MAAEIVYSLSPTVPSRYHSFNSPPISSTLLVVKDTEMDTATLLHDTTLDRKTGYVYLKAVTNMYLCFAWTKR